MPFIETSEVKFDDDGYAVHRQCGTMLAEVWQISREETYLLKRDGTTELDSEAGADDKDCDGVWCDECDEQVTMETA